MRLEIGRIVERVSGVGAGSLFVMANQRFHAVNFMGLTVKHKAFTVHYRIHVSVQPSLIAVDPFDIFQLGGFVKQVEEAIAETSDAENCDYKKRYTPISELPPR